MASDEDEAVFARPFAPWPPIRSIDEHVNALENNAVGLVFNGKDTLHPKNVGTLFLNKLAQPIVELLAIAVTRSLDAHAGDVGVVVMVTGLEEMRIHFHGAIEVEATDIHDLGDVDVRPGRAVDDGKRVHVADPIFKANKIGLAHKIAFIEKEDVRKSDLLGGFVILVDVLQDVLRIHEGHHAVDVEFFLDLLVHEERLHDWTWVGEAGGLDEDVVKFILPLHEVAEDANEVAANRAADAPVVHFKKLLVGIDDQLVVDAHLTEFILDDGNFEPVLLSENAVQQRGFSSPEEAGENRDRYA